MIEIIGYIAATITTASFVPQVIKVMKDKQTRNISLQMYLLFTTGISFWLAYGIMLNSVPIIAANGLTLIFSIIILAYKLKYK